MDAPPHVQEYAGTFGPVLPCIEDDTDEATVTSIDLHFEVEPVRSELWLRTIAVDDSAQWSTKEAIRGPTLAILGAPPRFDQPYAHGPIGGSFERLTFPATFSQRCADVEEQLLDEGEVKPHTQPLQELMVTLHGKGGAYLTSLTVHYTAHGDDFVQEVPYTQAICGPRVDERECPR